MKTRLKAFFERMRRLYVEDGLFHDTEVQANRLVMRVLIANAIIIVLIVLAVLYFLRVFIETFVIACVFLRLVPFRRIEIAFAYWSLYSSSPFL